MVQYSVGMKSLSSWLTRAQFRIHNAQHTLVERDARAHRDLLLAAPRCKVGLRRTRPASLRQVLHTAHPGFATGKANRSEVSVSVDAFNEALSVTLIYAIFYVSPCLVNTSVPKF